MKWFNFFLLILFLLPSVSGYYHHTSPIEWQEYSQATFDRAEEEQKPMFMLITAVWCYWCHVYRDETLHTPEVTKYLNSNFIPIFIDADQRQDLTRQYLAGGWPSTILMDQYGTKLASFSGHRPKENLLVNLQQVVKHTTVAVKPGEASITQSGRSKQIPTKEELEVFLEQSGENIFQGFDSVYGGYGNGQKFPRERLNQYMLDLYTQTSQPILLEAVTTTLNNMQREQFIDDISNPIEERIFQGIYDPVDGGFFRYSTRRDWSVPHYEKMLFRQAQIIQTYLQAYDITGNEKYREIAEKSLQYVLTQLYDEHDHRFFGSQDAGHEEYYRLTPQLRRSGGHEFEKAPTIDTTTYMEWSAEMIPTLFDAAEILDDIKYSEIAEDSLEFLLQKMIGEHGVLHYYNGLAQLNGQLIDNAWMTYALIDAYEYTGKIKYRDQADELTEFMLTYLYDNEGGGLYERNSTTIDAYLENELFLSEKSYTSNALMSLVFMKLYQHTNKPVYRQKALETMGGILTFDGPSDDYAFVLQASALLLEDYPSQSFELSNENLGSLDFSSKPLFVLLLFAFIAGILSFLSPCTLPILPAYFAYGMTSKKITRSSVMFFLGLAVIFGIIGMTATFVGRVLQDYSLVFSRVAGAIVLLLGITTLLGKGFSAVNLNYNPASTRAGSFLFGITFGISWTPCIGPILASLIILASTTLTGGLLLIIYAIGLSLPLIVISHYFDKLDQNSLFWRILRGKELKWRIGDKSFQIHTTTLMSSILLIILGILMVTGYLYSFNQIALNTPLQQWIFSIEEFLIGVFI